MVVADHLQEYEVGGLLTNASQKVLACTAGHFASCTQESHKVLLEAAGHSWRCSWVVQINVLVLRDTMDAFF